MLSNDAKERLKNIGIVYINDRKSSSFEIDDSLNFFKNLFNRLKRLLSLEGLEPSTIPSLDTREKTVIVIGTGRGGTSIVAGVLNSLGVFMGDLACAPVFEDRKLAGAYESKNNKLAFDIICDYNTRFSIWGFKRPSCLFYLPKLIKCTRNPVFIFVFKDLLSIGNRECISMQTGLLDNMRVALKNYQNILNFIDKYQPKSMLVSADKILENKVFFIEQVCEFLELQVTQEQILAAEKFIERDPSLYLDRSRITKAEGHVDEIIGSLIRGWARLIHSNTPPVLEVFVNNELVMEVLPNIYRPDLKDNWANNNGHVGFEFELKSKSNAGDVLRIKAKQDVEDFFVHHF